MEKHSKPLSKQGPSTAWLALTEACNNRCAWCYENENSYLEDGRAGSVAKHLSLADLQVALPTLQECGLTRTILIGGEPTLNPNICEIISYVCFLGLDTTLVTNGRSSSKFEIARAYAKAGLQEATVSLHGWSPESYEGRGSASNFTQALSGFFNLQEVGIKTGATMVLGSHTLGHEEEIANFLSVNNISQVQFNAAAPAVSPRGVDASFTALPQHMAAHSLLIYKLCTSLGILCSFQLNLPFCLFDNDDLDVMLEVGAIKQSCHVIHGGGVVVRPELKTAVCTHLMEFAVNSTNGATIYEDTESFLAFWRSRELESARHQANAYRRPDCNTCPRWDQCGGGCMVHWSFYDPITFGPAKSSSSISRIPVVPI